ncbi:MAG: universal stress protein [Chloroflexi bacterium]|nr:universal stress protein [Chloroflexota bacterium]
MAHVVSHKLSNSFEGALAGGGDPATSPLYVFGPFLKLIVVAGVAEVTFGASIWLVILTVAVVSAMYRMVMRWVTDGSGGSGLSEEEFGGWAVKINAAITFVEYTLTFLVSMAAMVTFIADRFPTLNHTILGVQYRTFVAIALSVLTGWLVNRGPKVAARVFGPATAAVLALLWAMIISSIIHRYFVPGSPLNGVPLVPTFNLDAFRLEYLYEFTLAGYARILALMTGIEVFANLVAAYDGTPSERSKKAFGSLLIIMGSTAMTMLIVGPAILALSDPTNTQVSVFTQTMDQLLPSPLPQIGTLVGVAVLLSASAASAQGLQNLALGLKDRHYIPTMLGRRNRFGVAPMPVWIEVGIVALCFVFFGTSEETYLAIYAAGVFILLSMTGWAASKRLIRVVREDYSIDHLLTLVGAVIAALLTTIATILIFAERFREGAWTYFLFIPALYLVFDYYRRKLGPPTRLREELGRMEEAMWITGAVPEEVPAPPEVAPVPALSHQWRPAPKVGEGWRSYRRPPSHILVHLDGSKYAEKILGVATGLVHLYRSRLTLASILQVRSFLTPGEKRIEANRKDRESYLQKVAQRLKMQGVEADVKVAVGPVAETLNDLANELNTDLIVMSTRGHSGWERLFRGSVAAKVMQLVNIPLLLGRPSERKPLATPPFKRVLVPLDGSEFSERILPYVRALDPADNTEVILLTIPEVPEAELYGAMSDMVDRLRQRAEHKARIYLEEVARALREDGLKVRVLVIGTNPARTITHVAETEKVDVVMMTTHGRGGLDRVFLGSVAERVVQRLNALFFLLPIHERRTPM